MKLAYSTGNPIVDEVSQMNITGNVIPETWYHTMCGENGKPMLLAINLLSDILYWYRAKEIRDEETGSLLAFQKRFKADMLQRSYRQIENHFGVSQKQARNALDYLCDIGVVKKHLRNEKTREGMPIYNNMYLELVPEKLKELTYPQSDPDGVPFRELPSAPEGRRVVTQRAEGGTPKGTTNTENTTEIITRDYNNPIYAEDGQMEALHIYEQIIKEQIEYEYIIQDDHGMNKKMIDEIVNLIVETVAIEQKYIRIGGERYPYQLVKGKFLKLDSEHIRYVITCMKSNTTKIKNIKNYLLTALYNAPNTIDNYYQAEVNHDLAGGVLMPMVDDGVFLPK